MAIVYDWYENPNAEGESEERGLHPRPLLNGKVSMEQLYYRVHERSSLSVGDAKSAIDTLTQRLCRMSSWVNCQLVLRDAHISFRLGSTISSSRITCACRYNTTASYVSRSSSRH